MTATFGAANAGRPSPTAKSKCVYPGYIGGAGKVLGAEEIFEHVRFLAELLADVTHFRERIFPSSASAMSGRSVR